MYETEPWRKDGTEEIVAGFGDLIRPDDPLPEIPPWWEAERVIPDLIQMTYP